MGTWAARIINLTIIFFNFLFWVACLDGMGGVMHTLEVGGVVGSYYYNKVSAPGFPTVNYSDCAKTSGLCSQCQQSGSAMVFFLVFCWFSLWVSLIYSGARTFTKEATIPKLNLDAEKCLKIEFILAAVQLFFFFCAMVSWGPCYTKGTDLGKTANSDKISPVGLGFLLWCFFMLLLQTPLLWFMWKKRPDWHHAFFDDGVPASTSGGQAQPRQSQPSGEIQNMGVSSTQPDAQPQPVEGQPQATNDDPNAAVVVTPQI